MSEAERRDAFEDDVRTALFRPGGELKRLQFRLMGFAVGLALLVTLAPTWLTARGSTTRIYSGISLLGLTPGADSPMGALGTVLFLLFLLLAVALLVAPPDSVFALVAGIAGLVATFVIVVNRPESETREVAWTGAPAVALGLWVLVIVVAGVARSTTRG